MTPSRAVSALTMLLALLVTGCSADEATTPEAPAPTESAAAASEVAGAGGASEALPSEDPTEASARPESEETGDQLFPDVLSAELTPEGDGTYGLAVTVSSPYDTPERYADGWRVLGPDDEELGTHMLGHDHAGEQPFTRSQQGLEIPDGVSEITVEGRDQANGYGGDTVTVAVP